MSRHLTRRFALLLFPVLAGVGCQPLQPAFFFEDGDLSHYVDVAQEIEYPDTHDAPIDEVTQSRAPLTLDSVGDFEFWDLTLEEAIRITLSNSQVIRSLGGGVLAGPEFLTRPGQANTAQTVYDPAAVETRYGVASSLPISSGTGVEAALSEFDADFSASTFWEKSDRPQNFRTLGVGRFFTPVLQQDSGSFQAGISKTSATGGTYAFRHNSFYEFQPPDVSSDFRGLPSVWNTNFEAEVRQPLLQGAGAMYNRIAGPHSFEAFAAGQPNPSNGVMIARINVDLTLADFECGVRDLLAEVENAYAELYFRYRDLDAKKAGRDSALQTWKKINALATVGARGGEAEKEAQARSQYFFFRSQAEQSLTDLYAAENRLRYLMGLAVADGRLIRPKDELTTAEVEFDWKMVLPEAVVRRCEVRRQKWEIKKRELELIASKNHLLPRLDAVGLYRFNGMGQDLLNNDTGTGIPPNQPGSSAFETLFNGDFQEWQLGLQMSLPIGFRQQLAGVRHQQLLLSRDKAVLDDLELEISHQLASAIRNVANNYQVLQTNFNRRVAAAKEVEAVEAAYENGTVTLDLVLNAQNRRADAEISYFRSLVDYNTSIMDVHRFKGSLLDYNGVFLAEGPWPKKAYFDALRRARERDAALYMDYGYTRPKVVSRGPVLREPGMHDGPMPGDEAPTPTPAEEVAPGAPVEMDSAPAAEELPAPAKFEEQEGPVLRQARVIRKAEDLSVTPPPRPTSAVQQAAAWKAAQPSGQPKSSSGVHQLKFEDFVSGDETQPQTNPTTRRRASAASSGWKRAQH